MPILDHNVSMRLFADYKATVYTFLEDINHFFPKFKELFTALQSDKTFFKLNFRDSFNQCCECYARKHKSY